MVVHIVLGVAVLALLIYRQLIAQPVNASTLRLLVILGAVGALPNRPVPGAEPLRRADLRALRREPGASRSLRRAAGRDGQDLDNRWPGLVAGQLADRLAVGRRRGRAPGI